MMQEKHKNTEKWNNLLIRLIRKKKINTWPLQCTLQEIQFFLHYIIEGDIKQQGRQDIMHDLTFSVAHTDASKLNK